MLFLSVVWTQKEENYQCRILLHYVTDTKFLLSIMRLSLKCFYISLIFLDLIDGVIFTNVSISVHRLIKQFSISGQNHEYFD